MTAPVPVYRARLVSLSLAILLAGCLVGPAGAFADSASSASAVYSFKPRAGVSESDRLAGEALRLISENNLEEASVTINKALQQKIDKSYYHLINGLIYHLMARQGKPASYEVAAKGYEMALRFDPGNWMAHYYLGRLRIDDGHFDKAVPEFAEAMMLRPDDAEVLNGLLFAAYRSQAPDIAAGALAALKASGKMDSPMLMRNSAMVMAALGQQEQAQEFLNRLRKSGAEERLLAHLERRLKEWARYHDSRNAGLVSGAAKASLQGGPVPSAPMAAQSALPTLSHFIKVQGTPAEAPAEAPADAPADAPAEAPADAAAAAAPEPPPPELSAEEHKMVVVDVVMISTEETISSSQGVNLLSGLQIQFGGATNPAFQRTQGNNAGVSADSITRTITLPSITYSLNIFNAANQRNEVLARPTLVALVGRPSEFFSGTELTAVSNPGGLGSNPLSIKKDIGVQLTMTPTILSDGRLRMSVLAERTFIKTPNPDALFVQKLEMTKNKVKANVVMRFGETLILGGLSEKESDTNRDGVPLLQDVPVMQYLFSHRTNSDFQKSVLILITPRQPEYVYQPEKARPEHEKTLSEEDRPIASLRARYSDWFKPYPNWASVFHQLQENTLYREFRTGDVDLESWSDARSVQDRLRAIQDFLYY